MKDSAKPKPDNTELRIGCSSESSHYYNMEGICFERHRTIESIDRRRNGCSVVDGGWNAGGGFNVDEQTDAYSGREDETDEQQDEEAEEDESDRESRLADDQIRSFAFDRVGQQTCNI